MTLFFANFDRSLPIANPDTYVHKFIKLAHTNPRGYPAPGYHVQLAIRPSARQAQVSLLIMVEIRPV